MAQAFARWWSRGCLWAAGIRLEVEGREHLAACPAIYLFNHTSNLDFFVNAVLAPPRCLVFGKRELGRVPFLGWVWLLSGHPLIRRSDRDDWQRKLDLVASRLKTNRFRTIVAPEGTRNHGAGLLPFKKGPFHLALQSGAPLVPWVIRGAAPLMDRRGVHPGTIRVTILPPIRTNTWTPEDLDARIEEVRERYLAALG
jgi:putative phosphoserine phosphatase/1-acylglycerol-3-phosphate O-acyltransferase